MIAYYGIVRHCDPQQWARLGTCPGQELEILEIENSWFRIEFGNEKKAWNSFLPSIEYKMPSPENCSADAHAWMAPTRLSICFWWE